MFAPSSYINYVHLHLKTGKTFVGLNCVINQHFPGIMPTCVSAISHWAFTNIHKQRHTSERQLEKNTDSRCKWHMSFIVRTDWFRTTSLPNFYFIFREAVELEWQGAPPGPLFTEANIPGMSHFSAH